MIHAWQAGRDVPDKGSWSMGMELGRWIGVLAVGVAAGCGAHVTDPAAPLPPAAPDAPAVALDTVRLHRDVAVLAHDSMEGRQTGTAGNARARAFLLREFAARGLEPVGESYEQPFTFTRQGAELRGVNLVGRVRGTELPDRYLVVTAHYDHLGVRGGQIYNGADDNASGVAGLLALAEWFAAQPPRHGILFVATDAEELGLAGARAFVAAPPVPRSALRLNVNLDMIGRSDRDELHVAGTYHYPMLLPAVERALAVAEVRLIPGHDRPEYGPAADWTMLSDHGAFHEAGIPFLYFGVEDHADYHRPTDTVERLQPGFHARAVRTVLRALLLLDREL
jgi:hypothetical protein